jgi:hypothetical protein
VKLQVIPISIKDANLFVTNFHRHNKPVRGAKFAIGVSYDDQLVGVGILGRPVARKLDDGFTAEVVRSSPRRTKKYQLFYIWQTMENLATDGW